MAGSRRDQRFTLRVPWEGALRVPSDVTIERFTETEVWVVSAKPAHRNEMLTLDASEPGLPTTMNVRVAESVPVLIDGVVRHRLRLAVVG